MSKDTRRTCLYMGIGVLIYEIILSLAAIPFARLMKYSVSSMELGILVGTVLVLAMVVDMGISTEDSLYGGDPFLCTEKDYDTFFTQEGGFIRYCSNILEQ